MHRTFVSLLAIMLVVAMLATGCAGGEGASGGEDFKIGLVTDVGRVNDRTFNQSAWEGVQDAAAELGVEAKYIETKAATDYLDNIRQFTDEGYDVIVTVGYALGDATLQMAAEYPDTMFIGVYQFQAETVPNVAGLVFHEDHAGYLAGVLAANLTTSGTIGGVFGTDLIPAVVAFREGYEAGGRSVKPDINIISAYHPGEIAQAFTANRTSRCIRLSTEALMWCSPPAARQATVRLRRQPRMRAFIASVWTPTSGRLSPGLILAWSQARSSPCALASET